MKNSFNKWAYAGLQISNKKELNKDEFLKLTEFIRTDMIMKTLNGYLWNNFSESHSILLCHVVLPGGNSLIQIVTEVRQRLCKTSSTWSH